jgi:hypothetical protein
MAAVHIRTAPRSAPAILFACGAASSLTYLAIDLYSSWVYPGYRFADQAVSELSAIGAPTRPLWLVVGMAYNLLLLAFASGVWTAARGKWTLRVTALLLAAIAVLGGIAGLLAPMHQRGTQTSLTDTVHVIYAAVTVVCTLAAIGCAAAALRGPFRVYSLATIGLLLAAGMAAFAQGPRIPTGGPTAWFGVLERINIYGYLLWVALLGVTLLRRRGRRA